VLGGGVAVAPPSKAASGWYEVIEGSLNDLDCLPAIKNLGLANNDNPPPCPPPPEAERIPEGRRNNDLFLFCLQQAPACPDAEALLALATAFAATELSPIPKPISDAEIRGTVMSAWKIETRATISSAKAVRP
jgi:hypothetical protein